jgi:hypothetical protein
MKTTKCLQCSSSKLYARDLCKPCYLASWHLINSRQTTWTTETITSVDGVQKTAGWV